MLISGSGFLEAGTRNEFRTEFQQNAHQENNFGKMRLQKSELMHSVNGIRKKLKLTFCLTIKQNKN